VAIDKRLAVYADSYWSENVAKLTLDEFQDLLRAYLELRKARLYSLKSAALAKELVNKIYSVTSMEDLTPLEFLSQFAKDFDRLKIGLSDVASHLLKVLNFSSSTINVEDADQRPAEVINMILKI
jgi:hypothetical protein